MLPLGFQILDMKHLNKAVRIRLRTASFGFTLIEMTVSLMIHAFVISMIVYVFSFKPTYDEDTFTHEKMLIRSLENVQCIDELLYASDQNLNVTCRELDHMILVQYEGKVFYVKKQERLFIN